MMKYAPERGAFLAGIVGPWVRKSAEHLTSLPKKEPKKKKKKS
jgi:hypothetical protein